MQSSHQERLTRAKSLLREGAAAEAAGVAEAVASEDPGISEAWSILGAAYFELEEWLRAEEAAREVVRLEPQSARAWSNLGTILRKGRKYDAALEAQEKALALDRGYRRAEVELGKVQDERRMEQGWKVRTPNGDYLGPLSTDRLQELVLSGEVEPQWNARQGLGPVTTVRDAVGSDICGAPLRGRSWVSFGAASEAPETREERRLEATARGADAEDNSDPVVRIHRSQLTKVVPVLLLVLMATAVGAYRLLGEKAEVRVRKDALSAVRDLDDAASVGVVYLDYRRRVIDARQSFRRAHESSAMPEGRFWGELEEALHDYENAADYWADQIDADGPLLELRYENLVQESWSDADAAQRRARQSMTSDLRLWSAVAGIVGDRG